jgi:hypothetical protein
MINGNVIEITEVLERSVQGSTLPFLCRGADDLLYYVKGRGAGRRSLICEWLAYSLASAFGLPIAEYRIVEIPESMSTLGLPDFPDLGTGFAFGSLYQPNAIDLPWSYVDQVPIGVRRDVVVFDWWIRNEDRTLTEKGGNPNMLWDVARQEVVIIDYNLSFDDTFDVRRFWSAHAFCGDWNDVFQDWLARPVYEQRICKALESFEKACDKMPDEWLEVAPGVPSTFTPDDALRILERIDQPGFWDQR